MKSRVFNLILGICLSVCCGAKVKLPAVLSDHMVLQQQEIVRLWGVSSACVTVEVSPSWDEKVYEAQSSSDGKWWVELETPSAGGPYVIRFNDGEIVELKDVYIGEVWLCSGQSNMEMPLKGYVGQPVSGSTETIADANPEWPIRLFTVERNPAEDVQEDCKGVWRSNTPEHAANFSAVAYYFGLRLFRSLRVPIGLVNASWGASNIQTWMSAEALASYPEEVKKHSASAEVQKQASLLYNGMIHPLEHVVWKGVIWYQGEANRKDAKMYKSLFPSFVKDWRQLFGQEQLPFYYVQIAPFGYGDPQAVESALLREAQYDCEAIVPDVAMAVTMDIGNKTCIHPEKKKEVGDRLAFLALNKTYGESGIPAWSPRFSSVGSKGNRMVLSFERVPMGLTSYGQPLRCFEIIDETGLHYVAQARIVGKDKVEVWNERVDCPVAVRYAFRNFVQGDLFGVNGMPVSSFRTD